MDGDSLFAIDASAVVGNDDEYCVGPERFLFGGAEELAKGVIRVLDCVVLPLLAGVFGDSALGIGVRFMVRDGEDSGAEGLAGLRQRPTFLDRALEDVLVANPRKWCEPGARNVSAQ
jgi:hypothetical protein